MYRSDVMTPGHPRWNEFVDMLSHAVICSGNSDNARRVLVAMGGLNETASLEALRRLGGRCDCEIVFEVAGLESSHS
jgi:hypothetical protein